MTTSPLAGDSQIANALTTLGTTALGSTRNELLTQLIVAAANATGGGSGGAAWGDITGTLSAQTDLQTVLDGSTGGNGTADSGKLAKFTSNGGVNMGALSGTTGTIMTVLNGSASNYAIDAVAALAGGAALHIGMQVPGVTGISTHFTGASQILFDIDGSTADASDTGIYAYMAGPVLISADETFNEKLSIWAGKVRFTAADARAASYIDLVAATPTGARTLTLPDVTGTIFTNQGGTMTGALINSTNGAASTPSLLLSGTPFTGGSATTTKPLVNIETAGATSTGWSTSGTMLGVNGPSGFAGNLADWQVDGASKFTIGPSGDIVATTQYFTTTGLLAFGPYAGSGGGYLSFFNDAPSAGRWSYFDSEIYLSGGYGAKFANARNDAPDCGVKWGAVGVVKITDAAAGRGTLDAAGYQVGGVAGANFSGVATNITVVNGLITAIS